MDAETKRDAGIVLVEALERAEAAEALLYGLTPGGSEFAGDPARCAQWVRDRLTGVIEQVQMRKAAEARIAQIVALLGDAEKRVVPGKSNEAWLEAVEAWRDAS